MSFIDSYKRLEKLCSEIYNDNHGVSSYIDEMINTPIGARYVPGWDDDEALPLGEKSDRPRSGLYRGKYVRVWGCTVA